MATSLGKGKEKGGPTMRGKNLPTTLFPATVSPGRVVGCPCSTLPMLLGNVMASVPSEDFP